MSVVLIPVRNRLNKSIMTSSEYFRLPSFHTPQQVSTRKQLKQIFRTDYKLLGVTVRLESSDLDVFKFQL